MQLQSPGRMVLPRHARVSAMSCWSQHDSRLRASLQLNMSAQLRSSVYPKYGREAPSPRIGGPSKVELPCSQ